MIRQEEIENQQNGTLFWKIRFESIQVQRLLPEQYDELSRYIEVEIAKYNKKNGKL